MPHFSRLQSKHLAWLATPSAGRTPATRAEWAAVLGVNERTLARWERQVGFWDAVFESIGERLDGCLPDVMAQLQELALRADLGAIRLVLDMRGHGPASVRPRAAHPNPPDPTPAARARAREDVAAWEEETFGVDGETSNKEANDWENRSSSTC